MTREEIIDETLSYMGTCDGFDTYVTDTQEEIARLITEGYTKGILSRDGMTCSWDLKTNCFGTIEKEEEERK